MFLSNPAKSFLACFSILLTVTGCGWLRGGENANAPMVPEPKSKLPFRTKEPENFQCEIVETAGQTVRKKRLAKKGTWRRIDFDFGEKGGRSILRTDAEYLIDGARGVYAERTSTTGDAEPQFSDLTHELLTAGPHSEFERIGSEGGVTKFRVHAGDGDTTDEIVTYYDESIELPVKQEFFSGAAGERRLEYTVEMVDFKAEPDAELFMLPAGFRKIVLADFYRNQ